MKWTGFVSFCLLSLSLAQACELDPIIDKSEQLQNQGREYAAIHWLNQFNACKHARITLELGQLHLSLGDTERAIELWEQALDTDLPASVSRNVKLRIIQAKLNPPQSSSVSLRVSAGQSYDTEFDHQTTLTLNSLGRLAMQPHNAFGYRLTPEAYLQLTSQQIYRWSTDTQDHLLFAETGLRARTKPVSLSAGFLIYSVGDSLDPGTSTELQLSAGPWQLTSGLQWRGTAQEWRWQESLHFTTGAWRTKVSAQLRHQSGEWFLNRTQAVGYLRIPARPELKATWHVADDTVSAEASTRWPVAERIWFRFESGLRFAATVNSYAKLSLNWQPF